MFALLPLLLLLHLPHFALILICSPEYLRTTHHLQVDAVPVHQCCDPPTQCHHILPFAIPCAIVGVANFACCRTQLLSIAFSSNDHVASDHHPRSPSIHPLPMENDPYHPTHHAVLLPLPPPHHPH